MAKASKTARASVTMRAQFCKFHKPSPIAPGTRASRAMNGDRETMALDVQAGRFAQPGPLAITMAIVSRTKKARISRIAMRVTPMGRSESVDMAHSLLLAPRKIQKKKTLRSFESICNRNQAAGDGRHVRDASRGRPDQLFLYRNPQ